jgi:hypothetical protein
MSKMPFEDFVGLSKESKGHIRKALFFATFFGVSQGFIFMNEEVIVAICFGLFVYLAITKTGDMVAEMVDAERNKVQEDCESLEAVYRVWFDHSISLANSHTPFSAHSGGVGGFLYSTVKGCTSNVHSNVGAAMANQGITSFGLVSNREAAQYLQFQNLYNFGVDQASAGINVKAVGAGSLSALKL